jgi:uncharacterized protein YndB with AHSA1/START domain
MSATATGSQYDLTLDRLFDAPRELVWKAWIDTSQLAEWWGPKDYTNPVCRTDARPGGAIYIEMRAHDGTIYPMNGTFHEVVEPERIVFSTMVLDAEGKTIFENMNAITLTQHEGKTLLRVDVKVIRATAAAPQYLKGMEQGWSQSLDRLAAFVTK